MPISSTGSRARGVTLMELMVVMAIIALIFAIALPSTLTGLENLRLASGARSVAAFMSVAANRAERRQQAIEVSVSIPDNAVVMRSAGGGFTRKLDLPPGIRLAAVLPALADPSDEPRQFLFLPGGSPPRMGIEIANHRGERRIVRLNPVTGVAEVSRPGAE